MADADADTKLEQFFALEMALFFEHLNTAAQKYADTGELPNSLFGGTFILLITCITFGGST